MTVTLDKTLIYRTKRRKRPDGLSPEERIAVNLFKRQGVKVPVLAKAFRVSKNTLYYKSFTGEADSYPNSQFSNSAADTNALIESVGEEQAWSQYVKPEWITLVNEENAKEVRRREIADAKRPRKRRKRK